MNKEQFVASSYLVGQRGPVPARRIRSLVLALSLAAVLGLNFAQGPQSALALNFSRDQPSAQVSAPDDSGGGAGITDGTLLPAIRPSAGAIHFV